MFLLGINNMSWYKKTQNNTITGKLEKIKDHWEKILGLGKYKPKPSNKPKKEPKRDGECMHSMDMHCDGGDDGW